MKKEQNKAPKRTSLRKNRQIFGNHLIGIAMILLLVFVWRLGVITYGSMGGHNLKAQRLGIMRNVTQPQAERGAIVSRDGTVIADSGTTYKIYAQLRPQYTDDRRKVVKDRVKTAKVLNKYLKIPVVQLINRLHPQSKLVTQVEFGAKGKGLSLATKKAIEKQKLPGISFEALPSRRYPNGAFATYPVGMVATTEDEKTGNMRMTGKMGLEQQFNKLLRGQDGYSEGQVDGFGYALNGKTKKSKPVKNGGTVYTTLDHNLQSYLETLMTSTQEKYAPLELTATVMSAKTGAILATSERPTFDPVTGSGLDKWSSALYQDAYEPGSVMKMVTLASAVDSGHYNPNQYYQSGSIQIGGGTVSDWNHGGWGMIPLSQAFPRSSNTGMVKIEQTMGAKTWRQYLEKFGFTKKTGILLPNEAAGNLDFSGLLSQVSTSFGQAINVTQVQMLQAMTAIANDGEMVQPRIVDKTVDSDGKTKTYPTKRLGRVVSKAAAKTVRDAMVDVVNQEYGTGTAYKIPGINLGVKTGTAQVAGAHGYLTGNSNYTFSVAGMIPIDHPKYIVYVTLRQPQKMTATESEMLNSIFTPLVKRTVALKGLQGVSGTTGKMPNVVGDDLQTAIDRLEAKGQRVAVIGSGNKIVQQLPATGQAIMGGSRSIILTDGAMTMPSVIGWGKSDVLKLAQITGVPFTLKGEGFASEQTLKDGSLLTGSGGTIRFKEQ